MKVQDVLLGHKSTKNQLSVEDARKAMIEAGELPSGLGKEVKKNTAVGPIIQTPTVTRSAAAQRQEIPEGPNTEIVAQLTYVDGTIEEITVKNKEALVAAVDDKSKDLSNSGQPTRIAVTYQVREKQEDTKEPVQVKPAVAAQVNTAPKNPVERVETKDFIAEIRQENGQWIGEIKYKNGAGTEKFTAKTKNDLTLQMLVGKGNATVKVRKVIREQKLGVELDKSYIFEDLTQEEFDALPDTARQKLIDGQAMAAAVAFKQEHPDYLATGENWNTIRRFLDKRKLPITFVNLEYAFDALTDDEMLEVREEPTVSHTATQTEDSVETVEPVQTAPAVVPETVPAVQVRKRGTTGLQPSFSSAGNTELDITEDGGKKRELSESELRALPMSELKSLYQKDIAARRKNRQF